MEQGQCWMQTKRKFYLASNNTNLTSSSSSPTAATTTTNPSYDDSSWEEQAFAEDAAGNSLGGCIWPPRSYSCSFCRREFRSAQALGGHMNVHRRDRARLKNPSSPNNNISNNEILHNYHHDLVVEAHVQNIPFTSLGYNNSNSLLYPCPPVCGLAYKSSNPNSSDLDHHVLASSSSPSSNQTLIPLCNSSVLHKTSTSESWPNLCSRFHPEADVEKVSKGLLLDSRCRGKKVNIDDDDDDVSVSLNLVVCRTHQPNLQFESTKEEDIIINCKKKRKITDANSSSIPILPKSSSSVDHRHDSHMHPHPEVFELSPSSNIEELDLELRLGNRSKV